jgi:hypothetical protein
MKALIQGVVLLWSVGSCGTLDEHRNDIDSGAPPPIEFSCAGGCETAPPMGAEGLTEDNYYQLLQQVAAEPVGTPSLALETLLFHGDATRRYLDELGASSLTDEQENFLRAEVAKTSVTVAFRVVDEEGVVSASLVPTTLPLGEKQHVHLETEEGLGDVEAGGTVRRVGLNHVWSRW